MMPTSTHRLYYTEPRLTSFDAIVTDCRDDDGRHLIVLDRTAFYPTSGGQPHDLGTLDVLPGAPESPVTPVPGAPGGRRHAASVIDVVDGDDGSVLHVTDRPIDPGTSVHGTVDAHRRFDHMQQHTGQHVLSAAFDRLFKARTVGFHLGARVSTLDLDTLLAPDALAQAESEANRVVWENRPVTIRFATPEEAAALPLRKDPVKAGQLRLIEVDGYDLSACGGTHVARSGEIGLIAIRSWEKLRGGTRLEFLCGGRALDGFRQLRDSVTRSLTRLSVAPEDLPAAIKRVQEENKFLQRAMRTFQERLAGHEASALRTRGQSESGVTLVVETVEGWDQHGLKALAAALASCPGVVTGLLSASEPAFAVIARASDVTLDASAVLKALVGAFGGKGGGKPDLAQGGGIRGARTELEVALRDLMRQALRPSP